LRIRDADAIKAFQEGHAGAQKSLAFLGVPVAHHIGGGHLGEQEDRIGPVVGYLARSELYQLRVALLHKGLGQASETEHADENEGSQQGHNWTHCSQHELHAQATRPWAPEATSKAIHCYSTKITSALATPAQVGRSQPLANVPGPPRSVLHYQWE
jgi:hypothetical protein